MRRKIAGLAVLPFVFGMTVIAAPSANAAPINCPDDQTATKVSGGWECYNKADNPNNSEDPKNPNAGKDKF